jgi:D-xylose transport system ATP-binding protein
MSAPFLEARSIVKKFPGVIALKDVTFDLRPGEVHALCGENGAGKSTLIKLLSGLHVHGSYEGELRVNGTEARFASLQDAARAGIAVIYQELALVDEMSVAENIFLGSEPRTRAGLIDWPRVHTETRKLLDRFALDIPPDALVRDLGVGRKQLVEIVKALSKDSKVLILDEPTAALAEHEVAVLLDIIRDLRRRGIACIYISHKLDEVFAVADRITILRDGATITTLAAAATDKNQVIRHMVGREIADLFPRRSSTPGKPVLEVQNLRVTHPVTGHTALHDISFTLRAGEVLGIGGLMGAGRTELLMHLFGCWGKRTAGQVKLLDRALPPDNPGHTLRAGLALVSEDRRRYGLVLEQPIAFNLSLSSLRRLTRAGLLDPMREFERNQHFFASLRVKSPSLEYPVGKLSGGNQQKVVIGKALMTEPSVVFLDEPTRGIDVGAKLEIYETINRLTAEGKAVVLVSSELPELMGMSDRILMLCAGRLGGEFTRAEATPPLLMAAAMGQTLSAA